MVEALHERPIPDLPATHPLSLDIDLSAPYVTFTVSVVGSKVPINETTQLLAEYWMLLAVELAKSQSASLAGSLVEYDYTRAINNIETLTKLLTEMTSRPILDLPETSDPGSLLEVPSEGN